MLNEAQYRFMEYLIEPNQGGLTLAQIAKKLGVSERILYTWKKDPLFIREYKKTVIRHTHSRLPRIVAAMEEAVVKDRNAAMAKLLLQMNDMLPGAGESVQDKLGEKSSDNTIEVMNKRIEEYRKRRIVSVQ